MSESGPQMRKPFVLVTGASGFLGAHIVVQLLDAGYRVRCTARGLKARFLEAAHAARGSQFAVVEVEDLACAELCYVLEDIEAVIHVAFPAPGSMESVELLMNAVNATTNLLRQAYEYGINKFVLTSSYLAVVGAEPESLWQDYTFTDKDWSEATYDAVFDGSRDSRWVYGAAKKLAEAAAWDFAEQHPQVDLATVIPTLLLGPFAPGHAVLSSADLSTNVLLRALLTPAESPPLPIWPHFVDVRDAARAHILALEMPPLPPPTLPSLTLSRPLTPDFLGVNISSLADSFRATTPIPPSSHPSLASIPPRKRFIASGACFTWSEVLTHLCPEGRVAPELALPAKVAGLDVRWTDGPGLDIVWRDWRVTVEDAASDLERVAKDIESSAWEDGDEDGEENI